MLQLNLDLVSLLLCGLQLADQNVFMHLDFFFTLFHGHLKLVFSVFESVDFVSAGVNLLAQALNLKLHDVVLNEGLLLVFDDSLEVTSCHLVLKLELADHGIKGSFFNFDLHNHTIDVSALIFELFVRSRQKLEVFFCFLVVFLKSIDLFLQLGLFFL